LIPQEGDTPVALTDIKVRTVKPKEKSFKIADGKGLFLVVKPNGSKYWRFRYHFDGKEKLLAGQKLILRLLNGVSQPKK
jgi:hypothetical protein